MAAPIRMPDLGTVESEVTIARWLKAPGETVAAGEALLEVETDKGVNPVESVAGGVVLRRLFEDGAKVGAGEVIAWVGQPGDPIPGEGSSAAAPAPAAATATTAAAAAARGAPRVSPVVRALAERHGVDIASLRGSGPNGMVTREDVLRAKGGGAADARAATTRPAAAAAGPAALSANQAAVARKVAQSHREKPTFRVTAAVDMSAVAAHREAAKRAGTAPAWDAYLVAAAGRAIVSFPVFRRWMHGEEVREHAAADVAFAVASGDDLAAPVVRGADRRSLAAIAADVAVLAAKARSGSLGAADTADGCFLVSNLGMLPIEGFDAIVYPEHAAALAAGAVAPTVVARPDGSFSVRPTVRLTLTADHRLVNGLAAARFLAAVKDCLEQGAFA